MQGFKQVFSHILILISLDVFSVTYKDKYILNTKTKDKVTLASILKDDKNYIFLTEDNCSVCESIIMGSDLLLDKRIVIGLTSTPNFRWFARLKRKWPEKDIFNISGLKLNLEKKTPQLIVFDKNGNLTEVIYGRTKIFNRVKRK